MNDYEDKRDDYVLGLRLGRNYMETDISAMRIGFGAGWVAHKATSSEKTICGDDYLAVVERQRAEALATIERVKALAEQWRTESRGTTGDLSVRTRRHAYALFAAIDAHEPEDRWSL